MEKSLIVELFQTLVYAVLTTILPIITTYVIKILRAKLTQIRYNSMESAHADWIYRATDIVENIVLQVQQTFVDTLKKEGKFTPDTAKEAKDKAIALANDLIADEIKDVINNVYGSFDSWLDIQIEKSVYQDRG